MSRRIYCLRPSELSEARSLARRAHALGSLGASLQRNVRSTEAYSQTRASHGAQKEHG